MGAIVRILKPKSFWSGNLLNESNSTLHFSVFVPNPRFILFPHVIKRCIFIIIIFSQASVLFQYQEHSYALLCWSFQIKIQQKIPFLKKQVSYLCVITLTDSWFLQPLKPSPKNHKLIYKALKLTNFKAYYLLFFSWRIV